MKIRKFGHGNFSIFLSFFTLHISIQKKIVSWENRIEKGQSRKNGRFRCKSSTLAPDRPHTLKTIHSHSRPSIFISRPVTVYFGGPFKFIFIFARSKAKKVIFRKFRIFFCFYNIFVILR